MQERYKTVGNCRIVRNAHIYTRGTQPFWAKGCSILFLVRSRAKKKIMYELNFRESNIKNWMFKNFTSVLIACGLILLPSELFLIVISCKIVNSSMKFKFIHIDINPGGLGCHNPQKFGEGVMRCSAE